MRHERTHAVLQSGLQRPATQVHRFPGDGPFHLQDGAVTHAPPLSHHNYDAAAHAASHAADDAADDAAADASAAADAADLTSHMAVADAVADVVDAAAARANSADAVAGANAAAAGTSNSCDAVADVVAKRVPHAQSDAGAHAAANLYPQRPAADWSTCDGCADHNIAARWSAGD